MSSGRSKARNMFSYVWEDSEEKKRRAVTIIPARNRGSRPSITSGRPLKASSARSIPFATAESADWIVQDPPVCSWGAKRISM